MLDPWATEVMTRISTALQHLPGPSFADLGPLDAPCYGGAEKAAITLLLQDYMCTSVDKLSNNMFLPYKHLMAHFQVDEIESAITEHDATYEPVPT